MKNVPTNIESGAATSNQETANQCRTEEAPQELVRAALQDLMRTKHAPFLSHLPYHDIGGQKQWRVVANESTYPVSRASQNLIRVNLGALASHIPPEREMVDLGPGAEESVVASLEIVAAIQARKYHLVEISDEVRTKCQQVAHELAPMRVEVSSERADIFQMSNGIGEPAVAYFGGSTIGNLIHPVDPEFPHDKLEQQIRVLMSWARGGWLLISFDTTYDREKLEECYGTAANGEFNRNLIVNFAALHPFLQIDPEPFVHQRQYVDSSQQVAHFILATKTQILPYGRIDEGDRFHVINSYKIMPKWFEDAALNAGADLLYSTLDVTTGIAVYLLQKRRNHQ